MKRTDQTLLEQMRISEVEIRSRMELLGLDQSELNVLPVFRDVIEQNIDNIVDQFYRIQTEIDAISLLIGDADTLMRLRTAQRNYVIDLFSGQYNSEYVNNRLRIGLVHKRIGVEPKLYLSAVRALKQIIIEVMTDCCPDNADSDKAIDVLDKLFYFDITLVFDTYIGSLVGEIETAKRHTENYAKNLEDQVAIRTRQLEEQARKDSLTNVYNRRAMKDVLWRELSMAKRRKTTLSLAYFDINDFKKINDSYGHMRGDEVLRILGQILTDCSRSTDLAFRYGGDEFCLVLPECNCNQAKLVTDKVQELFLAHFPDFSFSLGLAQFNPDDDIDGDELIQLADEKMYQAKKKSKKEANGDQSPSS
ncbi:GGDEF domain-containing protein [Oceanospirillum sediminis]|uniref:Diguanylate cyclase DosC n=1 Tax=Oceanospirillum sediminis TaxID=2760088 RepID=A0A839IUD9_9GAMM|nr:GGDEF domain-containing protein [Oceanospirillum sediminis]MBB1488558.1 GGDEF domain-containing protein [Oceanospirillum sediminis]